MSIIAQITNITRFYWYCYLSEKI